ncbi:MAG TPA: methylmalonyl Co-A mutase-associated GTPase MeaB [Candidatus Krumholzibacteria bacterium]|jgi:LAO/AO transport system kinase
MSAHDLQEYVNGILAGDRNLLSRAITLLESKREDHFALAEEIVQAVLPRSGGAHRIGITGVPGVGKSTLIEALGMKLVGEGHRVAVLAVDPSSAISGGSILGDKSRMENLARHEHAFIRPSPNAQSLGGVGRKTRESMLLCEAAGFDIVLVETVGVGQSETLVAQMVDCFLFLALPGAGDELQGIKRGIMEMADIIAVNKADGDQLALARAAVGDFNAVLGLLRPRSEHWRSVALMLSSESGTGLDELWETIQRHRKALADDGDLERQRQQQQTHWMWALIDERLRDSFQRHPKIKAELAEVESEVRSGKLSATAAARRLLRTFED